MTIFGLDLKELIIHYGALAVFVILFAESSFVFFLPGDSLLFVAGILISQHLLGFWPTIILGLLGAVLGNNFGYFLGKKFGPPLFSLNRWYLFKREHVDKVQSYYVRYGPLTVVLARFIPAVRTIAPIAAGVGSMDYSTFLLYNAGGAALWLLLVTAAGYFLGRTVPNIDHYILPIIAAVIVVSFIPGAIAIIRHRLKK